MIIEIAFAFLMGSCGGMFLLLAAFLAVMIVQEIQESTEK